MTKAVTCGPPPGDVNVGRLLAGEASGTQRARDAWTGLENKEAPGRWPGAFRWSG
ncbi:hypothetical protein GCM10023079_17510 [Streptomyces chitinivorans]